MRIALLASTFLPRIGGAELATHNLALSLQQLGHDVFVVTWWGQYRAVRNLVPYRMLGLLPRSFTCGMRNRMMEGARFSNCVRPQIRYLQRRYRFDVWNIQHAFPFAPLAYQGLKEANASVVVTPQGDDVIFDRKSGYILLESGAVREMMKVALSSADRVSAISSSIRNGISDLEVPSSKIVDIPNGVCVRRFRETCLDSNEVRRRYGLPEDVAILLSVGRNHAQKGYDLIPRVMERLLERHCKCVWLVVGADTHGVAAGENATIRDHIRCIPAISEPTGSGQRFDHLPPRALIEVYKSCDLFVLPSRMEGCPLVGAEALAAGLPFIGTTGMGALSLIDEGVGGFITRKEDTEAMADRIERLLSDKSLRLRMSQHNLEKSLQYDWDKLAKRYLDCYAEAIRSK